MAKICEPLKFSKLIAPNGFSPKKLSPNIKVTKESSSILDSANESACAIPFG